MTPQEAFESELQEQADTFKMISDDIKLKLSQIPLEEILKILLKNITGKENAQSVLTEWLQLNLLPIVEDMSIIAQDTALDTTAGWIRKFGISWRNDGTES